MQYKCNDGTSNRQAGCTERDDLAESFSDHPGENHSRAGCEISIPVNLRQG